MRRHVGSLCAARRIHVQSTPRGAGKTASLRSGGRSGKVNRGQPGGYREEMGSSPAQSRTTTQISATNQATVATASPRMFSLVCHLPIGPLRGAFLQRGPLWKGRARGPKGCRAGKIRQRRVARRRWMRLARIRHGRGRVGLEVVGGLVGRAGWLAVIRWLSLAGTHARVTGGS